MGLDEQPFPILRCFVGVTAHGGMGFTKTGAFSELFSTEIPVLLLSLQTRGSQMDDNPLFRCWGQARLVSPLQLGLCHFSIQGPPFCSCGPRGSWYPTAKGTLSLQMVSGAKLDCK